MGEIRQDGSAEWEKSANGRKSAVSRPRFPQHPAQHPTWPPPARGNVAGSSRHIYVDGDLLYIVTDYFANLKCKYDLEIHCCEMCNGNLCMPDS